jgi:uncharacterized small protein (DUF1192 family)/DNA-binding Lrp family transcriptional regulator
MIPINELFTNPRKAEYAAKAGMARTELGRTGAARVEKNETTGRFSYVSSVSGKKFDTPGEAFLESKKFLLTDYTELRYGASKLGSEFYDTRFSQAGSVLENLQTRLTSATDLQRSQLARIGLGDIDPSTLMMQILTSKSEKGKGATLAAKELEKLSIGFIPIVDGEGGAFLTMQALVGGEQRALSSAQMHMMSTILGSGLLNQERLQSALGEASMPGFVNKLPKRLRAFFSERDIFMPQEDITRAIGSIDVGTAIEDRALRVDSGIDYLRRYMGFAGRSTDLVYDADGKVISGLGQNFIVKEGGVEYNLIDELLDTNLVKATIDNLSTESLDKGILSTEKIKGLVGRSNSSKELLGNVEKTFGKNSEEYKSIERIMKGVKREFDGISVVNDRLRTYKMDELQGRIGTMQDQIKEIHADLRAGIPGRSRQEAEALEQQLYEIQRQYDIVSKANNLYQVTMRGGTGEEQIKSAANFADFDLIGNKRGLFSGFAAILDEEAIKGELGFNFKGFVFSGLGSSSDKVYSDPVSTSFLGELFASDYDIENMKRYSGEIMQEFNTAIDQNILPPRIKEMLQRTVFNDELDYLPEYMTETRIRNKEFARQLLEMHQSGISPKDSPRMMNMLASLHASEMFRIQTKGNVATYLPALPDVRRFALSTENAAFQSGTAPSENLSGMTSARIKGVDREIATQLLEFRVDDNRVLFGPGMTNRFYESLGGFDLDDKVLTKMMTYKDNGNKKRLLFGMYRQPSGPEESIYAKANLDEGTLRSYFQNERFRGLLEDYRLSAGGVRASSLDDLYSVLWNDKKYKTINADEAEQLVISIFDFAESRGKAGLRMLDGSMEGVAGAHNRRILRAIERQGSSSLANSQQYTRPGIFKIFEEENQKYNSQQGYLIKDQIKELLENDSYKNALDSSVYNQLKTALESSQFDEVNRVFEKNLDNPILSALKEQSVFNKMFSVATSEESAVLGTYVNRTMLVGSKLNQTQDLIEHLIKMGGQDGRIRKILEHQIGLVSQELAIDFSKSASGVMPSLLSDMDVLRESLTSVTMAIDNSKDVNAALRAVERIRKAGGSIDDIGAQAIENLGKRVGTEYAQVMELATEMAVRDAAAAEKFKERFLPKIDQQLLKGRAQLVDLESMIRGISSGIQTGASDVGMFKDIIGQLSEEQMPISSEARRDALIRLFGANEQHAYATVSRLHGAGTVAAANLEAMNNIRYRSRTINPALASFEYTEEARRAADFLLEKHTEEASRILNFRTDMAELNNEATKELYLRKLKMGDTVTDDIREAARRSGVSVEEMINTLRKRSDQIGKEFIYDDLNYFPKSVLEDVAGSGGTISSNLRELFSAAEIKRNYNYLESLRASDDVVKTLNILGSTTSENLSSRAGQTAKEILEASAYGVLHDPSSAQLDILALLSDNKEIQNQVFNNRNMNEVRTTMSNRLDAVMADIRYSELADEFKTDLDFIGRPTTAAPAPTTTVGKDLERVISGEEVSIAKAQFKRIGEFIKDGSLKNLFQENKLFKNSVVAIGALVVGSFAYQAVKDRSQEDIQGPPLLPGGSAYEDNYPKRMSEIPQIGNAVYNPGVDYKVNLYGNTKDVSNFRQEAMGLGKFNMNTTMYRRAPQAGNNPYNEVASSF